MGQSVDQLLEQVKQETADRLTQILSVSYPPASDPGSPPHMRTGNLLAGYTVDAAVSGETVTVTLTAGVPYADFLETGTSRMAARPHRQTVIDYLASTLPDRLAEAVQLDLIETLEPAGPAEPPPAPGLLSRVRSFFGF